VIVEKGALRPFFDFGASKIKKMAKNELFSPYVALIIMENRAANYFHLKTINKKSKNEGTHMTNTKMKPLALAFGASLLAGVATTTVAAENPFASQSLESGYKVAMEGKCGEGKCGGKAESAAKSKEGKCGEGKCGGKAESSAKSGEGKCGEGKCGGKDKAADKSKEGKCGEGKCGGKS